MDKAGIVCLFVECPTVRCDREAFFFINDETDGYP